jgi:large subunit ribosomal protein L29
MATTKTSELRDMDATQLQARLGELQEERFRLRFRSATEAIENPIRFRTIRRDIARIQTILRERAGQA